MSFYHHVVVAVDATPASQYAIGVGISLARIDSSDVIFAIAIDPVLASRECGFAAFEEIARQRARELLQDALDRAQDAGVVARGDIIVDHPIKGMIDLVRAEHAGILIAGQNPRQSMFNPFMGSIVEQVLRKSNVPLCAVRRPARGYLNHRLLVPIADDDLRDSATAYAVDLAREHGSTICFCTVAASEAQCAGVLAQAEQYAQERGIEARTRALPRHAGIVTAICEHAELESYDAIVMASHGRDGWPRLTSGSVAEAVINNSNAPVIVVRRDG
jgi:nucleotide-binding universal stress UspA family protein